MSSLIVGEMLFLQIQLEISTQIHHSLREVRVRKNSKETTFTP